MTNPDNPHYGLYRRRLGLVFAVVSPVMYLLDFALWGVSHQWWGTIFLVFGLLMIWYHRNREKPFPEIFGSWGGSLLPTGETLPIRPRSLTQLGV